jgi:hypothetical protein
MTFILLLFYFIFIHSFIFAELGFELRASHLLDRYSISFEPHPQLFFALVMFQVGSHIFDQGNLRHIPPTHGLLHTRVHTTVSAL